MHSGAGGHLGDHDEQQDGQDDVGDDVERLDRTTAAGGRLRQHRRASATSTSIPARIRTARSVPDHQVAARTTARPAASTANQTGRLLVDTVRPSLVVTRATR